MGSGYVRPVLAAGATFEYTVYLDGLATRRGLSAWAVTALDIFHFQCVLVGF